MYALSVQYSCAIVSVFLIGRKANLVLLTLFYSTFLALTHRLKDRQRNTYTCFAWAGGKCPCFAWAGGIFFQLCCCVVSVFGSGGKCGNSLYIIFWRIVLGLSGKQFLVLRTYLVYNTVVRLCHFFVVVGKLLSVQCTVVLLCQFFGCSGKQFVLVQLELKLIHICCIQGQYIRFRIKLVK